MVFALGVYAAARMTYSPPRRDQIVVVALVVLSLAGAWILLWPGPQQIPAPPMGTRWAELPTGTHLAYFELPGPGTHGDTPVIFLHGGPGVADMGGDAPHLRRLAAAGHDVFLYDQIGAGRSARLADPAEYTLARAVADLDAFRQVIRAEHIDLVGYSWGATLATAYLAAHPDNVAKVVFVSPGPMLGGPSDLGALLSRLNTAELLAVLWHVLQPRALLTWELVQVNPRAAHAYVGDAEMDARFRAINRATAPALYCHPPEFVGGEDPGFYAYATLLRRTAPPDLRQALRGMRIPALILKGACDYLSWSSAVDYRNTLPDAEVVYLPGAGHRGYAERPDVFFAVVAAFLAGQLIPLPVQTGSAPPPGFQGPP
jgi:proline iminopeptidase